MILQAFCFLSRFFLNLRFLPFGRFRRFLGACVLRVLASGLFPEMLARAKAPDFTGVLLSATLLEFVFIAALWVIGS